MPEKSDKRLITLVGILLVSILAALAYLQIYQSRMLIDTLEAPQGNASRDFLELERSLQRVMISTHQARHNPDTSHYRSLQSHFAEFGNLFEKITIDAARRLSPPEEPYRSAMEDVAQFIRTYSPQLHNTAAAASGLQILETLLADVTQVNQAVQELTRASHNAALTKEISRTAEMRRKVNTSTGLLVLQVMLVGLFALLVLRQMRQHRNRAIGLAQALAEAERRHDELSSHMQGIDQHALVMVISPDGRILQINDRLCQATGYSREELVGHSHAMLVSDIHPDASFAGVLDSINHGHTWYGEIRARTKGGAPLWIDAALVPLKDNSGRVLRCINVGIDITSRKDSEAHIIYLAGHDALTGLPNRTLLLDRIQQALAHNRRNKARCAVLFIDLDHFKIINDTFGHGVGDLLLKETANRLTSTVRQEDTVARQGGDEFIILLPSIASTQSAEIVAQKLLALLNSPFRINDRELFVSASIGIAVYPDDGTDADTLLKHSDIAMYHAKGHGRNNYQFFAQEMNKGAASKQALIADLRQALARGDFFLVYQPVIDIADGNIVSIEALLRWNHPDLGIITPDRFIALAEETGLIIKIGEWTLRAACEQLRAWRQFGFEVPRMMVNLSVRQLWDQNLPDTIANILDETSVKPDSLGLELRESMLVDKIDEITGTLADLNRMGLEISLDDFGTGYSSLLYLKQFPIHKLKIDHRFVQDIGQDPDDEMIVEAIIALAHGLKMRVVAEGVETREQLYFLREHGCDYYQGYYFSKPMTASEMITNFKRSRTVNLKLFKSG